MESPWALWNGHDSGLCKRAWRFSGPRWMSSGEGLVIGLCSSYQEHMTSILWLVLWCYCQWLQMTSLVFLYSWHSANLSFMLLPIFSLTLAWVSLSLSSINHLSHVGFTLVFLVVLIDKIFYVLKHACMLYCFLNTSHLLQPGFLGHSCSVYFCTVSPASGRYGLGRSH